MSASNFVKLFLTLTLVLLPLQGRAISISELKDKIFDRTSRIEQVEEEIKEVEKNIEHTHAEKQTLKGAIGEIEGTQKELSSEISTTRSKISDTNYTISELEEQIGDLEKKISANHLAISESLRKVYEETNRSTLEIMLSGQTLSDALSDVDTIDQLQKGIQVNLSNLANTISEIEADKLKLVGRKVQLEDLTDQLADQKAVADAARRAKEDLLEATENKEKNYQKLLAEKKALREQFEREILSFETQLKVILDPTLLPDKRSGILEWPVGSDAWITQYFGNTKFAQSGAYNGKGHNGMDFGVSIGTPVKSAEGGVVMGTGNTDLGCPGGSYGKWVLVKHNNGLSTLYAHLSIIKVVKGQNVSRGSLVGYSGNTGYSTGPHLHFTVYASEGVRIDQLVRSDGSRSSCTEMPLSPLNGYLNPLDYL